MQDEPKFNIPLARKVLEHIEAHPEEFDMNYWLVPPEAFAQAEQGDYRACQGRFDLRNLECGTKACLAGTIALLDDQVAAIDTSNNRDEVVFVDGDRQNIVEYGAVQLGLTYSSAYYLFHMTEEDEDAVGELRAMIKYAETKEKNA